MAASQILKDNMRYALGNEAASTEMNTLMDAVSALSGTESGYIDGVTAGTAAASKAVVLGASKEIATITTATITTVNATNVDAGASGTAGTVDVFPATASKGKFALTCENQDGNTTVTLKPAAMGQATAISIPDPGAATANVLLTSQANDGVVVTATAAELNQIDGNILADMTPGTGISTGTGTTCEHSVVKVGGLYKTTILVDLTGLNSGANANDVIGKADTANCHIGQITAAVNGTIFAGKMTCLEAPVGGDNDIDLWDAESATLTEDTDIEDDAGAEDQLTNGGDLSAGTVAVLSAFPTANRYLYLGAGTGDTNDTYTAGILLIELWGK